MAEVHPGSFVGDSVEEFKKLPTWGKWAIGLILVGVAAYALYQRSQGQTAQQAAASTAGGSATGSNSPFPMVGNLPVLPSNVNPVYDPNGNPVGFQQTPPPLPIPTPTPPPTPPPSVVPPGKKHKPPTDSDTGKKKQGFHTTPGPGPQRNPGLGSPGGQHGTPGGGSGGHMGSVSGTGTKVPPRTSQTHGTHTFMANPNVFHQAARPHVPSTVPQHPSPKPFSVQFQNTPYGSGSGTVNGIPLTPP